MATFREPVNPDVTLRGYTELMASRVLDLYGEIEARLTAEIYRRIASGRSVRQDVYEQLRVVRELETYARRLIQQVPPDLAARVVEAAGRYGYAEASRQMGLADTLPVVTDITPSAVRTLGVIAQELGSSFDQVNARILRYPVDAMGAWIGTDVYQQVVGETVGASTLLGDPIEQTRRRALATFLERGVTGFVDRAGRRWTIGSYTEMAVRSATARAHREVSWDRQRSLGLRLVSILGNNDACALCGPWFGKVLSIDGTAAGVYEMESYVDPDALVEVEVAGTIDDARNAGWGHPNCACSTAAYLPGTSIATAAPGYNEEAAAGRDEQRRLEREVRALKRRRAIEEAAGGATPATDSAIRDRQRALRELTAETGQKRRYDREQARWDTGAGLVVDRLPDGVTSETLADTYLADVAARTVDQYEALVDMLSARQRVGPGDIGATS